MSDKMNIKGKIVTHLIFPIFLTTINLAAGILVSILYKNILGLILIAASLIEMIVVIIMYFVNKPVLLADLVRFSVGYAQMQKALIKELSLPFAMIDKEGNILWDNYELQNIMKSSVKGGNILEEFKSLPKETLNMESEDLKEARIIYEDKNYRVQLKKVDTKELVENNAVVPQKDEYLIALYFFDETKEIQLKKENEDNRLVVGLIYIDNYDEAMQSVEEVRGSLLAALIDRRISKFVNSIDGILKKTEKDKYFIAFKHKYLDSLKADKFSIIDDIKTVNVGNEIDVTLSIGLGVGGATFADNLQYSRASIDMALGRGGSQVVLKENDKIFYYGGKSKQVEKNTRVKARVKAHALRELLINKDKVIIMGHQIPDIDSFGSAIGIYRAAKSLGKRVYIVLNEVTSSLRPVVDRFKADDEYEDDLFIKSEQALNIVDNTTVVIVVDVGKPSYTECPELLKMCKSIVVLDHHRQAEENIENAELSYIEPYASSACEMVAEIVQYIGENIKVRQIEADVMYGGIMLDTNNFANKAGVRTFEAAAFLRRCGADISSVRLMFRTDVNDFIARAKVVSNAEVFLKHFAISKCDSKGIESPTILGAQAANELLNISGINASFVLTDYNGKIYVSARSIDDINVQLIMERMGGGGHMNAAGTQIEGGDIDEVAEKLKLMVEEMLAGKEI